MTTLGPTLRRAVAGILLAFGGATSLALEWVATNYHGTVAPLQPTLDVAFSFRNTGANPVTIRSIQTNCDCLAAATDKAVYQPGEAGLVTARFTVGERYGLYQRAITVLTDDAPPQKLSVAIEVPEPATVEPRELHWALGSPAEERHVEVTVVEPLRIDFTEVYATNEHFHHTLEVLEPARRYRVRIAPKGTATVANAAIRIAGKASSGEAIVVSAYANVR